MSVENRKYFNLWNPGIIWNTKDRPIHVGSRFVLNTYKSSSREKISRVYTPTNVVNLRDKSYLRAWSYIRVWFTNSRAYNININTLGNTWRRPARNIYILFSDIIIQTRRTVCVIVALLTLRMMESIRIMFIFPSLLTIGSKFNWYKLLTH